MTDCKAKINLLQLTTYEPLISVLPLASANNGLQTSPCYDKKKIKNKGLTSKRPSPQQGLQHLPPRQAPTRAGRVLGDVEERDGSLFHRQHCCPVTKSQASSAKLISFGAGDGPRRRNGQLRVWPMCPPAALHWHGLLVEHAWGTLGSPLRCVLVISYILLKELSKMSVLQWNQKQCSRFSLKYKCSYQPIPPFPAITTDLVRKKCIFLPLPLETQTSNRKSYFKLNSRVEGVKLALRSCSNAISFSSFSNCPPIAQRYGSPEKCVTTYSTICQYLNRKHGCYSSRINNLQRGNL